jgi:hypothetical protein
MKRIRKDCSEYLQAQTAHVESCKKAAIQYITGWPDHGVGWLDGVEYE